VSKSIVQCGSPRGTGTPTSVTLDAQMWGSTNPTMSLLAAEKARPNGMRKAAARRGCAPPLAARFRVCCRALCRPSPTSVHLLCDWINYPFVPAGGRWWHNPACHLAIMAGDPSFRRFDILHL
jgi:hypothetical protein